MAARRAFVNVAGVLSEIAAGDDLLGHATLDLALTGGVVTGPVTFDNGTGSMVLDPTGATLLTLRPQAGQNGIHVIASANWSRLMSYGTAPPVQGLVRYRGTEALPTALLLGDEIGRLQYNGAIDALGGTGGGARIAAFATENYGAGRGTRMAFLTVANTSATFVERASVDASGMQVTGSVTASAGFVGALTGNATTATKLATPRTINGVNFDGSAAITVAAAAGTLTGATLAAGVTDSSLTSVGTLAALGVTGAVTAGSFVGPLTGNATTATTAGSAATATLAAAATVLATPRNINGVAFDGSADITVADATKLPLAGGALTGPVTSSSTLLLGGAAFGGLGYRSGAGSGSTGAHADAGDFVLDGAGNAGLSILSPSSTVGSIFFGDEVSPQVGRIQYSHATDSLAFTTAASLALTLTAAGDANVAGSVTAVGTVRAGGAVYGGIGYSGGAYGGGAPTSARNGIVLERNGSTGISILTPNTSTGSLTFADSDSLIVARIDYNHATDTMTFVAASTNAVLGGGVFTVPSLAANSLAANSRVLVGGAGATVAAISGATAYNAPLQVTGTASTSATELIARFSANALGPILQLAKARDAAVNTFTTVVSNNDELGVVSFAGSDGVDFSEGAAIRGVVDGTAASDDMPGKLYFQTSSAGSRTPTTRMTINALGAITCTGAFGFNGKAAVAAIAAPAAATDLATAITLVNSLRLRAQALGLYT